MVKVETRFEGNILVVSPRIHSLDTHTVRTFQIAIDKEVRESRLVLLDFIEIDYVDSSGIGCILKMMKEIRERGGDLKLSNLKDPVRRIFDLVGLGRLLEIHETLDQALDSFQFEGGKSS